MKNKRSPGISLGVTLVLLAVAVTLTFALASTSVFHLSTATRMANLSEAEDLAESVLSLAIERLVNDQDYGYQRLPTESLEFVPEGLNSRGRLTFNQNQARAGGYPFSTNNLTGDSAVAGWDGRVVPSGTVHLVGSGTVQGVRRHVEAILHLPGFRYAIASSGPVRSDGNLLIAGLESADQAVGEVDEHELLPGHILSNSTIRDNLRNRGAITIGPDSQITGDVQAVGGVVLDSDSVVLGQVKSGADSEAIPEISIDALDPNTLKKSNIQYVADPRLENPVMTGWLRTNDDLEVVGGLQMDGAAIFVDGDLTVEGGVSGTGAIIVTGETIIGGGASLQADNELALISGDSITLNGDSASDAYFQGLIYTEGDFRATDVTVVGSFIANGSRSEVVLENARVLNTPGSGEVSVDVSNPLGTPFHFDRHGGEFLGIEGGDRNGGGDGGGDGEDDDGDDDDDDDGGGGDELNGVPVYIRRDHLGADSYTLYEPQSGQRYEGLSRDQARNQVLKWLGGPEAGFEKLCCNNHNIEDFSTGEARFMREMGELKTPDEIERTREKEIFTIDSSKFLKFQDRVRLLIWRTL